jgi:hypothetical protein
LLEAPVASPSITDLFGLDRAMTPQERKRLRAGTTPKGYAALPGSGPAGETCGSCENLVRRRMARTYLKCGLRERGWTGGTASDVRAGAPACSRWSAPIRSVVERSLEDGRPGKSAGTSGADLNGKPEPSQQGNDYEQSSQTLAESVGISFGLADPVADEREHGRGDHRKGQGFKHAHLPPEKPAVGGAVLRRNGTPEVRS